MEGQHPHMARDLRWVAGQLNGLTRPRALIVGGAALLQLVVLASIRLLAADPTGGDLCRDAVAIHRILRGQNPYQPITGCGTLYNLPHPPAFLLLIGPFAALPVAWGALLWDLGALASLAVGLALIAREKGLAPRPWLLGLLLVLLIFWPPLLGTLLEAQISPALFLLLVLAWRWARRGQTGWAGAALGVAAALRLFPGLAILYFAIRRDWRAVVAAAATAAISELLAFPFIGIQGFVAYITREAPSTGAEWLVNAHNVSAWGFAGMVFAGSPSASALVRAPALAAPFAEASLAALVGILAVATFVRRHRPYAADEGTFLAYVPLMLLASPLTWTHYFIILLLPILVLGARIGWFGAGPPQGLEPRRRVWLSWLLGSALALVWINDIVARQSLPHPLPAVAGLLVFALPTYALVCLYAGLLLMDAAPAPAGRDTASKEITPSLLT
jgi:Glycosyltransferase family 87